MQKPVDNARLLNHNNYINNTTPKDNKMTAQQLAQAYEAHRTQRGRPVRCEYLGGGRYRIAPIGSTGHPVSYVRTGAELRALIPARAA